MYTKALSMLALAGAAQAHMSMYYPAPLGGAPSINPQSTNIDPEFNFPLGCCGSDGGDSKPSPGLCRGYLDKFDTEEATVTWQPGQDAYFQLTDHDYDPAAPGGTHYGGSCQVGFSTDKGKTWKLAASYHGACPHATEDGSPEAQTFDFKVPTNMPEGDAIFMWLWLNREHEAFENCAKVHIGGSGSGSGTEPSKPSSSATQPEEPAYSEAAPEETQPTYSQPEEPSNDEDYEKAPAPAVTPVAPADGHNGGAAVTITTVVATTVYQDYQPTEAANSDSSEDREHSWWGRAHKKVQPNTRRYQVDGSRCDCRRDELTLAARCSCDSTDKAVERKALRLHRRTFYKRFDACDWNSAPAMETSYYTVDANCAAGAKDRMPESDDFELGWDVPCGVVEGQSEYEIKTMTCDMYG
ncbi:lytic polysaccharide monooxygenase [Stemphylium lycopersici]|uniref:Lytic polysaccharide monooxygenase n=1 Tax=Stemphylium lycopersici TaxID=183478 RepID=A0A364NB92_STELY|nr:lytic polysaccharide monooxygenase [Stemphylium lycopersici]RAR12105.1 lytic polysaccharide monooxygenase [Stemphylium lycopersici]RAR14536.1 lytic polysaccharide monooxygenase [Stemphylium lycopersici]